MSESTRHIYGPPTISFYNFGGTESALSYTIPHIDSLSYADGKLSIAGKCGWALIQFLKQSGIIFSDAFRFRAVANTDILGWIVGGDAGKITRSTDNKFGRLTWAVETDKTAYITKNIVIPKKYSSSKYKLYLYVSALSSSNLKMKVTTTAPLTADVDLLASTAVGLAEITGISNKTSSTSIKICIGKTSGADIVSGVINGVCVFALPYDITATTDHVPFFPHYVADASGDTTGKSGLTVEIPFTDSTSDGMYVFRNCSVTAAESWGLGEDIAANIEFSYGSLSVGE